MKHSYLRLTAAMIAVTGLVVSAARGDETATVLQYKLSFGGGQPVSTFYLAYQPSGGGEADAPGTAFVPAAIGIPVFSTDSTMATMLSVPSLLMSADGGEKFTVGESLLGVIGAVIVFGAPIYAIGKLAKDTFEPGYDDVSYGDPDPSVSNPNAARERK